MATLPAPVQYPFDNIATFMITSGITYFYLGHIWPLFLHVSLFSKSTMSKNSRKTGFKPQTSGVRSNRSGNYDHCPRINIYCWPMHSNKSFSCYYTSFWSNYLEVSNLFNRAKMLQIWNFSQFNSSSNDRRLPLAYTFLPLVHLRQS